MRPRDLPAVLYVAAVFAFVFLPVVTLVQFSFQDGLLPVPPFRGVSLRWYEAMFADRRLMAALRNSVAVAGLSSAAATALGFLAAYGLAILRIPGTRLVLGAALGAAMFPPIALVGPLFTLFDRLGLWTVVAVILVLLAYGYPIYHQLQMPRYGSPGFAPF